jgi:tetratricopeptide (TPR) repeat protein
MRIFWPIASTVALAAATQVSAQHTASTHFPVDSYELTVPSYAIIGPARSDFAQGRDALAAGDYDRAVRLLEPLADGSMNPADKLLAGYANLGAGRARKAERHFAAALALDHGNPLARHGLGLAALSQGQRDAALDQLESLERAKVRCGGTCERAVQIDIAAQSLRRAIV